jgi:hypothetical protein
MIIITSMLPLPEEGGGIAYYCPYVPLMLTSTSSPAPVVTPAPVVSFMTRYGLMESNNDVVMLKKTNYLPTSTKITGKHNANN